MKEQTRQRLDRLWRCGFKKVYSHDEAVKRSKNLRFTKGSQVYPFRCRVCRGWHIGTHRKMPKPKPPPEEVDMTVDAYYY